MYHTDLALNCPLSEANSGLEPVVVGMTDSIGHRTVPVMTSQAVSNKF
jgi:hypothetical protein